MPDIQLINKLLQDELAATETYVHALDYLRKDVELSGAEELTPLLEAHKTAVASLQSMIIELGGTPIASSGAWGTWASVILGGANLLGKDSILKALHEGEQNGQMGYTDALKETELPADLRTLINEKLLPAQLAHIHILEKLLDTEAA